jgi:phosphatidylinositol alpha-1,6-mannosyltransferase
MAVFVMPCRSRWFGLEVEGLGLVFLEAAASGLPVLAGDSGGSPETVDPGVTGFVVSRDEHIVEGLRMLLEDPARAAVMGAAGRERVLEEFTWEAVSARFSEAVRELGDGRTPGHRS